MNASQLFKAAHELARKVRKTGDDYRATFGLCLQYVRKFGVTVMSNFPEIAEIKKHHEIMRQAIVAIRAERGEDNRTAEALQNILTREEATIAEIEQWENNGLITSHKQIAKSVLSRYMIEHTKGERFRFLPCHNAYKPLI